VSDFLTVGFCFANELEHMHLNPREKGGRSGRKMGVIFMVVFTC
jgi:hypothetical protein